MKLKTLRLLLRLLANGALAAELAGLASLLLFFPSRTLWWVLLAVAGLGLAGGAAALPSLRRAAGRGCSGPPFPSPITTGRPMHTPGSRWLPGVLFYFPAKKPACIFLPGTACVPPRKPV